MNTNYETMQIQTLKTRWENVAGMIEKLGNSLQFVYSENVANDRAAMIHDLDEITRAIYSRSGTLSK
jgi:hypothetical protein